MPKEGSTFSRWVSFFRSIKYKIKKMRFIFATVAAVHMEPFVTGPLATQPLWQAGAPTTIKIHYDVPVHGPSDEVNRNRGIIILAISCKRSILSENHTNPCFRWISTETW